MNNVCLEIWNLLVHQGYIAPLETPGCWRKVPDDCYLIWNCPSCIGSMDGKHVVIIAAIATKRFGPLFSISSTRAHIGLS